MTGKYWQPSHEPPRGRETNRHPSHCKNSGKRGRDRIGKTATGKSPNAKENVDLAKKLLQRSVVQEHVEFGRMRIFKDASLNAAAHISNKVIWLYQP